MVIVMIEVRPVRGVARPAKLPMYRLLAAATSRRNQTAVPDVPEDDAEDERYEEDSGEGEDEARLQAALRRVEIDPGHQREPEDDEGDEDHCHDCSSFLARVGTRALPPETSDAG